MLLLLLLLLLLSFLSNHSMSPHAPGVMEMFSIPTCTAYSGSVHITASQYLETASSMLLLLLLLLQLVYCDHGHWLSGHHSRHLPLRLHW
jgi:hypothetical protein